MRPSLVILAALAALTACTTGQRPPAKQPPAAPAVDVQALLTRDGLISYDMEEAEAHMGSGQKSLRRALYAELDGIAPQELILHTDEYIGEGAWSETLWFYDATAAADPRPVRAAGPRGESPQVGGLSWGSYMDAGWWLARDLDRDGRDEILVIGDTDGVATSSLSILGWGQDADGQGAMIDRLWRAPAGVDVVIADGDRDGIDEVIALGYAPETLETPGELTVLKRDPRGVWRPVEVDQPAIWLQAAFEALVTTNHPRLHIALPALLAHMRAGKSAPRDITRIQPAIARKLGEARRANDSDTFGPLCEAMAWPGNQAAYEVLLPLITQLDTPAPLMRALLLLDAQHGSRRGQDAILAWMERSLQTIDREEADGRYAIVVALRELEEQEQTGGAAIMARWLVTPAAPLEERVMLARMTMRHLSSQLGVLSALWAEDGVELELREVVLEVIADELPDFMTSSTRWRSALTPAILDSLMARPELALLAAQLGVYTGDAARMALAYDAFEREASVEQRTALIQTMRIALAPPPADAARLERWLKRASAEERDALLTWIVRGGEAAAQRALAQRLGAEELERWIEAVRLELPEPSCSTCPRLPISDDLPALTALLQSRLRDPRALTREAAIRLLAALDHAPAQQLVLASAMRPGDPLHAAAREAILHHPHAETQGYLLDELARSPGEAHIIEALGRLGSAQVAQALAQRVRGANDVIQNALFVALQQSAPRGCAADTTALEATLWSEEVDCWRRGYIAATLALCDPSWLERLAEETRCEGVWIDTALERVGAQGLPAHRPLLERMAERPGPRQLRDAAWRALQQLK